MTVKEAEDKLDAIGKRIDANARALKTLKKAVEDLYDHFHLTRRL
jgi:hypothetical protein